MDAKEIETLGPRLADYLHRFDDCFGHDETRQHLVKYVQGQLSDLPRKSVEPIALASGTPPRTLQQFLSLSVWDHDRMRERLQQIVAKEHSSTQSIGLVDETSAAKKGAMTPGVQRQWCGSTGKTDNCVVTVHLGYAAGEFRCLVDSELYLPESWSDDFRRCDRAGIPGTMHYRPKWQIALTLQDRALSHGLKFEWITFDEGYGGKPQYHEQLSLRHQLYIGEVPKSFMGWIDEPPKITERNYRHGNLGRHRKKPRIVAGSKKAKQAARHLLHSETLSEQSWVSMRIKDTSVGPMVWEIKHCPFYFKMGNGLPSVRHHLIISRNVLKKSEVKYFVSNAPEDAALETMLIVAFSRWNIERCFEDEKTELGLDHYEGRSYKGLIRHQIITAATHLFLAKEQQRAKGKKTDSDSLPNPNGPGGFDSMLLAEHGSSIEIDRANGAANSVVTARKRESKQKPYPTNQEKAASRRHPSNWASSL